MSEPSPFFGIRRDLNANSDLCNLTKEHIDMLWARLERESKRDVIRCLSGGLGLSTEINQAQMEMFIGMCER